MSRPAVGVAGGDLEHESALRTCDSRPRPSSQGPIHSHFSGTRPDRSFAPAVPTLTWRSLLWLMMEQDLIAAPQLRCVHYRSMSQGSEMVR